MFFVRIDLYFIPNAISELVYLSKYPILAAMTIFFNIHYVYKYWTENRAVEVLKVDRIYVKNRSIKKVRAGTKTQIFEDMAAETIFRFVKMVEVLPLR